MQEALYSEVLAALPDDRLAALTDHATARRLDPGDFLVFGGERCERIHLVTAGVLKLMVALPDGEETLIGLAAEGDLIGAIATVDASSQPFDAVAATAVRVLGFDAEGFLEALRSSPAAALALSRCMADEARRLASLAAERSTGGVSSRIAGHLLYLAEVAGRRRRDSIEVDMPLMQEDLGRLAGTCRESACRAMRRFRSQGLIDYRGRKLRIYRPDVLERIRCAGRAAAPFRSRPEGAPARSRSTEAP